MFKEAGTAVNKKYLALTFISNLSGTLYKPKAINE